MDKKTVYIKTAKGEHEAANLSSDLKRILSLIDSKSKADELARRAPPSLRESWNEILGELIAGGYIVDKDQPQVEPKFAKPKFNPLKMFGSKPAEIFVPKPVAHPPTDDLDFSAMSHTRAPDAAELAARHKVEAAAQARADLDAAELAAKQRMEVAERARAELEASVAAAKIKANAEAATKAQAKARLEAEIAARARAEAEAKAKQEAMIRVQAEAKAKQEAELKLQAQHEAARAKAALEVAARAKAEAESRVRAEIELAARAQQEAEAKTKREAEAARLKVEQESARVKAEIEAVAKAKADVEAAKLNAEKEAARIRIELEAAKARAEAEAKALAEARIRQEAEEKARREAEAARLKAEEEAARMRAELEAAKARAEAEAKALAEARIRQEAEEKARREAEAARLKAEQEAALIRAEQEAVARVRAEAKAAAEILAREQEAEPAPAFEINLNGFLGDTAQPVTRTAVPAAQDEAKLSAEAEAEAKAGLEAEQRAAADAKEEAKSKSAKDAAAEMARLKAEAEAKGEAARRKAEEEARRRAEEQALAEEQAKAWAEAEQRAKAQAAIEVGQSAQQAAMLQARTTQKPGGRIRRKPLPFGKIALGLVTLALVAAVILPYVYPLKDYIAPLEQRLSAQLKQPVHIGGMSASSLPPRLQLQNVTVGNAQEVKAVKVVLNFDPISLLSEVKVISDAELEDVSIEGRLLDKQAASLKLLGSDVNFPIRHLTLQRVKIVSDDIALPIFSGIADIDAQGVFSRVSLHSADDKLGIDLQSNQGRWQLGVNLRESSLPVLPDVVFSDLSAKGDLGDGEVNFTEMDAHIYNGILLGKAKLSWRKGWQLQGNLDAKTFDLDKMFPQLHLEGEMFGEGTYSMTGAKLSQMDDDPRLDGTFTVKKGTFNVDMVETARLLSREHLVGGRTHFDDMIGQVRLENHAVHFRQLKIVSGVLSSSGSIDVSSGKQLSGSFNAEIKMREGSSQLTLFGTLAEQKLRAGR